MYRAVFIDDEGVATTSLCYSDEKKALDDIMRRCPGKDMIDEARYLTYHTDMVIIVLREVFDDTMGVRV